MNKQAEATSKAMIFDAIAHAKPTTDATTEQIQQQAAALLEQSPFARPALLANDSCDAFIKRIESGLVIGTTCEIIPTLFDLPATAQRFLDKYSLAHRLKVQEVDALAELDWRGIDIDEDIEQDQSVGLSWAEYGIAETGSLVIHSSADMPILLNFLPLYQLTIVAKSRILPYLDDYGDIANNIAAQGNTPRNMCLITGASGTADIEGVLVQGAHGPEFLHIVIIENM